MNSRALVPIVMVVAAAFTAAAILTAAAAAPAEPQPAGGAASSPREGKAAASPAPVLRYLGHSSFLITTPKGKRILIDPYASGEWPGLRFPVLEADLILITHPHWDHAAVAEVKGSSKVASGPGVMEEGDFRVTGIAGRHAALAGAHIGYVNTIYVIETGGVRVVHLGDNGPISESPGLSDAIGPVDVLLIPIDAERRVLNYDEAKAWIDALAPRLVFPMHYRLAGLTFDRIQGIGGPEEWLSGQPGHRRLAGDTMKLDPAAADPQEWPAPGSRAVRIFTLPGERVVSAGRAVAGKAEALEAKRRAEVAVAGGDLVTALEQFQAVVAIDPDDAETLQKIGFLHLDARRPDLAADFLARSARAAGMADRKIASLSWLGAGMAYDLMGRREEAKAAYQAVVGIGLNDEQQADTARAHLETPYTEH